MSILRGDNFWKPVRVLRETKMRQYLVIYEILKRGIFVTRKGWLAAHVQEDRLLDFAALIDKIEKVTRIQDDEKIHLVSIQKL